MGAWHGGARGWAEIPKLLRRLCPTWLPASAYLMFGQKLASGQEKKWNIGRVWYGGKEVFCSAGCAEGCAQAGAGLSPLPVLQRERSGVLEQKWVLCFIHRPGRGL